VTEVLSDSSYLRERIEPRHGDELYLHLADLRKALDMLVPYGAARVLDYGCGGSPYRSLFSGEYDRADIAENPDRNITLSEDSLLPAEINPYDLILSTQVLEHVRNPALYLSECHRALRPGGELVITTHGLFEDHPCPHDFWRWTVEGLSVALEDAGFLVERALKVTVGPRATLFFLQRDLGNLGSMREINAIFPTLFAIMRKVGKGRLHKFADARFGAFAVRDRQESPWDDRYIALAIKAVRR
jgi:SAM-dependent methyltransferase